MRWLAVGLALALLVWGAAVGVLALLGRRADARELAALVPNLLLLFRDLLREPRVPRSAKLWLLFAVAWIASPVDLVPEFIPLAGPLDDAIVAALVLRHLLRRTPWEVLLEHWRGDPATLAAIARRGGHGTREA
ncbi:MAG: hypothetical protein KatS3mg014_1205 [Actinomycetota bacterium]|nr:MAG: hypothetical protein KatS3mg014_1205 [Actinomycetota bacterium]